MSEKPKRLKPKSKTVGELFLKSGNLAAFPNSRQVHDECGRGVCFPALPYNTASPSAVKGAFVLDCFLPQLFVARIIPIREERT